MCQLIIIIVNGIVYFLEVPKRITLLLMGRQITLKSL